jgi:hypothetical protein
MALGPKKSMESMDPGPGPGPLAMGGRPQQKKHLGKKCDKWCLSYLFCRNTRPRGQHASQPSALPQTRPQRNPLGSFVEVLVVGVTCWGHFQVSLQHDQFCWILSGAPYIPCVTPSFFVHRSADAEHQVLVSGAQYFMCSGTAPKRRIPFIGAFDRKSSIADKQS